MKQGKSGKGDSLRGSLFRTFVNENEDILNNMTFDEKDGDLKIQDLDNNAGKENNQQLDEVYEYYSEYSYEEEYEEEEPELNNLSPQQVESCASKSSASNVTRKTDISNFSTKVHLAVSECQSLGTFTSQCYSKPSSRIVSESTSIVSNLSSDDEKSYQSITSQRMSKVDSKSVNSSKKSRTPKPKQQKSMCVSELDYISPFATPKTLKKRPNPLNDMLEEESPKAQTSSYVSKQSRSLSSTYNDQLNSSAQTIRTKWIQEDQRAEEEDEDEKKLLLFKKSERHPYKIKGIKRHKKQEEEPAKDHDEEDTKFVHHFSMPPNPSSKFMEEIEIPYPDRLLIPKRTKPQPKNKKRKNVNFDNFLGRQFQHENEQRRIHAKNEYKSARSPEKPEEFQANIRLFNESIIDMYGSDNDEPQQQISSGMNTTFNHKTSRLTNNTPSPKRYRMSNMQEDNSCERPKPKKQHFPSREFIDRNFVDLGDIIERQRTNKIESSYIDEFY